MGHLPVDVRVSLRFFAFYLANGTIDVDLLDGFDYRPALFQFGSSLEQVFAIYGNVLEIDEEGNVLNEGTRSTVPPSGFAAFATRLTRSSHRSSPGRPNSTVRKSFRDSAATAWGGAPVSLHRLGETDVRYVRSFSTIRSGRRFIENDIV
ncbi:hypothetical protein [Amycolatopsis sp. MJM2582]|uniref:DUF7677 family protein n=1 Tax=Amycolatopsis sp. MJM2582 TaxID=1427749 RepID=UPI00190F1DF3|nr:hypothetical protein [Amycolatopsis sp. MJM2582]